MGFPGLLDNSYDAIAVATADSKVEFTQTLGLSALTMPRFAQYLIFQYDEAAPDFYLGDHYTTRRSIMPPKRSPSPVERLRLAATEVTAHGVAAAMMVHNMPLLRSWACIASRNRENIISAPGQSPQSRLKARFVSRSS